MSDMQLLVKIEELKGTIQSLSQENAQLRFERDLAVADAKVLSQYATEEQEAALMSDLQNAVPFDMEAFITELETAGGAK